MISEWVNEKIEYYLRINEKQEFIRKYLETPTENYAVYYGLIYKNHMHPFDIKLKNKVMYIPFVEDKLYVNVNGMPKVDHLLVKFLIKHFE